MGDNYKTWILVLALAIGGVWQVSRSRSPVAPAPPPRDRDWEAVNAADDEPYSAPRHAPAVGRPRPGAPAVMGGPPRPTSPPPPPELSPDELTKFLAANAKTSEVSDNAKKKEEKCEPKTDPKTGKPIPCKTKKKKKKETKDAKVEDKPKPPKAPAKSDDHGPTGDLAGSVGWAVANGRVDPDPNKPDQPYDSQASWEARLLSTPDLAATKQFIDHFQRNLVSSEVFYAIAQEMLNDSRDDMRLLGVMCAGVNQSQQGFTMLAQFAGKQSAGTASRTQADQALNLYADLGTLPILASVLRSPTQSYPTVLALQKLDAAAKKYLTTAASTTPATPTTPVATGSSAGAVTPVTTNKNRAAFTKFTSIVTTLSKNSDASIKSQATRTLANLQALLGTTPTAPVTPAPGSTNPAAGSK